MKISRFSKIFLLSICLVSLAAMAACSGTPATTPTSGTTSTSSASGPWPGVPVYSDSKSPIRTRVNATFSIVLPNAPIFGWGWQDQDLSAFTLVETKSLPGAGNQTEAFGPDAFLFKALKAGSYQIILYVPSKPPQQTETFQVTVAP
jgi:hypothetical protein